MKRILLSAVAGLMALSGYSQSPAAKVNSELRKQSVWIAKNPRINTTPANSNEALPVNTVGTSRITQQTIVGTSTYDLQTNASIQRRLINNPNGTVVAAWTFSTNLGDPWANRGTGYNYFNGNAWGPAPTVRIETERIGWPNPMVLGSGKEVILSHSTENNKIRNVNRGSVGSGTWSQSNINQSFAEVWNRSAAGGPNGNTIHMVGLTAPVGLNGTLYNGMDGAFLYNRSINGGQTWDILNYQIPGTDSSYYADFGGDSYAIDVQGNTVCIVIGDLGKSVRLFKSLDNGITWSNTTVLLVDEIDEATDLLPDFESSIECSDGTVNVLIDDQGLTHVWYGYMRASNVTVGDGGLNFYPFMNQIMYWNENMMPGQPLALTGALDINGNGMLDVPSNDVGQYNAAGLATHPQAGIDANGCIYLVYSAMREDLSDFSQQYRHTYISKTCDYGCSWSEPIDVTDGTSTSDFEESVFASIARRVDSKIHILYMRDIYPGISVSGDLDAAGVNEMVYLTEDVTRFDTTAFCPAEVQGDTLVCPGSPTTLYAVGCASAYAWTGPNGFTAATQSISATDVGTYVCAFTNTCGTSVDSLEVVLSTGTTGPLVLISSDVQIMCPGDTANLSAISNVGGSSFSWSTTETTPNISVTSPGTYTVTVTTCSGTTTESIVISQPTNAPQVIISGDTSICPGSNVVLNVTPVLGGTYTWSNGDQTSETTISAAGTYTVTVQNCGGSSTSTVIVTDETVPVAAIETPSLEGCEGEGITLNATGGSNFIWSNGSTSQSITLTDVASSGTYSVTVSNDCGDQDIASATISISAQPSAPVVNYDGVTYTSSQTGPGTHIWYVGGAVKAGYTTNVLPIVDNNQPVLVLGQTVEAVYVSPEGCASDKSATIIGIAEENLISSMISVYPNPNNGQFEIRFGKVTGKVSIEVSNVVGQVVYNNVATVSEGHVEMIDLSNLETGVYQVTLEGDSGKFVQSIIIQ